MALMSAAMTDLLGIRFTAQGKEQFLQKLAERIGREEKTVVLSANVHAFNLAYEQSWLRDFFNQADLIRLDGDGVRLGARLLGKALPPRMTWADFIWDLAAFAAPPGYRFFFLGGRSGVAQEAAGRLQSRYPSLPVVGVHHGFFNKTAGHPENEAVLKLIAATRPDILLVGMGMPLQERWIQANQERLEATVTMTAGALFDYVSGRLQRPPTLFTEHGLEWLGRLFIEPRRLWRRYLLGNPLFLWRVLRQRFRYNGEAVETHHERPRLRGALRKYGRFNWKITR
jgi:N-acetylglucosaminyldiphosphoundecaprenol N-acetyl-beta-D-mannosaminyltransferase